MSAPVWFQGSINEAVQLVNSKNCLFIVFIHDYTESSTQLDGILADAEVQDAFQHHVAIKLEYQSDNALLFGQLYPIQRVPMVYFIKQGIIKDFAIETTSTQDMIQKLEQVAATTVPASSPSATVSTSISSSATTDSAAAVRTTSMPASPTGSAQQAQPNSSTDTESTQDTSESLNDQIEMERKAKSKQRMEQARARMNEIEKENEKQRELKRRQDGKTAELTKQQLEDQQNKLYFAKLKKEKQADEEHRRKIKQQIARDREEKMAERQREKAQQLQQNLPSSSSLSTSSASPTSQKRYDECHLNIRQADGYNIKHKFSAYDTLGTVRTWIDNNRTDGDQPYKLLAQFPTRQFSAGDEEKTLSSLELVPSGTIIMKSIKNVATAYQSPSGSAASYYGGMVVNCVYSASGAVYNTLTGALSSVFNTVAPAIAVESDGHRLGGQHSQQQQPLVSGSRQIHGINTLRQQGQGDDDDDRKKTYNGNSVNQE